MPPAGGFIKLWRRIAEHPLWRTVPDAWLRVALGVLLKANWKPGKWDDGKREIEIPPGSFVASIPHMAQFCRVSVQQYRDAVTYLKRTSFITVTRTPRYHIVSVTNWRTYQADESAENSSGTDEKTAKEQDGNSLGTGREQDGNTNRRREEEVESPEEGNQPVPELVDVPDTVAVNDYQPQNRKTRDSDAGPGTAPAGACTLADIKDLVAGYMSCPINEVDDKIANRILVAVNGASRETVKRFLKEKWNESGGVYRPGHAHGPRRLAWFVSVLGGEFGPRKPAPRPDFRHGLTQEAFDKMSSSFDTLDDIKPEGRLQ